MNKRSDLIVLALILILVLILPACQPAPTATATMTPMPGIGSEHVNAADGAVLVYVPEGEFLMGSEGPDAEAHEGPEHIVYLDAFWIDKHEVTNTQFTQFIEDTGYQTDAENNGWSWVHDASGDVLWQQVSGAYWAAPSGPESDIEILGNHPVIHISWNDADAYCAWAGGRLPTEAEWEKAARGTDGRTYPWGETAVTGSKANYCDENCNFEWRDSSQDDGYGQTALVGSFAEGASRYGVLDMAGNVWEWTADWYDADYYDNSPNQNPMGPASGDARVLRGGSWFEPEWGLRCSIRGGNPPVDTYINFGFRCVHLP